MPRRSRGAVQRFGGFLLDEHIPDETARFLRRRHYRVQRAPRGTPDIQVLQLAAKERLVLITQDLDFRRHALTGDHAGGLIIRGRKLSREAVTNLVASILRSFDTGDFAGRVLERSRGRLVITSRGVRQIVRRR